MDVFALIVPIVLLVFVYNVLKGIFGSGEKRTSRSSSAFAGTDDTDGGGDSGGGIFGGDGGGGGFGGDGGGGGE